ncbi:MAG: peptidylprolyl isomerase [Chloroflexota bacterium]|nr:peptidylprolyl isomerase [Chloroflexota bacterium]
MSKKAQTTGAPKRRRRRTVAAEATQGGENIQLGGSDSAYVSRAEREEQLQKWVIRGVIAAAVVLVLLVAVTFAIEQLIIPNQAVAVVNGSNITVREFRQQVLLERNRLRLQINQLQSSGFDLQQLAQQEPYKTWISEVNVPDQLGLRVINDMVDDRLLAMEASTRNIAVDDLALRQAVEEFFGFDPTQVALIGVEPTATLEPTITPTPFVSPTPTNSPEPTSTPDPAASAAEATIEPTVTPQPTVVEPTLSPQEARDNFEQNEADFRAYLDRADVASDTVDAFFERNALEFLLADDLIPDDGSLLYADLRHILVDDEETAQLALEALQQGESFAALARAISTDPGSGNRGGELGLGFVGNYVREFRLAIESAEIGALVGPVESEFGFHILQVRSKEERAGSEVELQRNRAKLQELEQLRESLREKYSENFEVFDSWLDFVPRG